MKLRKGDKATRPVLANVGIQAEYRRKLDALIDEMARSYAYWLKAQYRDTPPMLAQDAIPARELEREMSLLGKRWQSKFDEAAPRLGRWFADTTRRRSSAALQKILADAGMTVRFQLTRTMRDAYEATVAENVGLIKSIAQEYHSQVGGMVMRSVTAGRDLGQLTKDLEARFGITRRRAALIARDQNNKASSVFCRVRQAEAGITHAIWVHSAGGKKPRPLHIKASGTRYDIKVGLPIGDKGELVFPGECINCRCVSKSLLRGFS